MSIVSNSEILSFLDKTDDYFEINASNEDLYFKYDAGSATKISISDGTYTGTNLAIVLKTALDVAFTISSTVSFSSSTRRFTISVSNGHSIQFIYTGSTGALVFGFTQNSEALVSINSDTDTISTNPISMIYTIRDHVESFIQSYCRRTFESTTYVKKRYNGTGNKRLFLDNFPVTILDRLTISKRDVIRVKNSDRYSTASISVTDTGIRLVKNGVADETVTFASYTTLSTLADAITAVGSGWSAAVVSSEYNNFMSSELVEMFGQNAIDSNYVYLQLFEEAEGDFDLDKERGIIFLDRCFPSGFNNVMIDYVAGYTSINMPSDLKLAVKIATKFFYQKWKEESWNTEYFSTSDILTRFDSKDFPRESLSLLSKYRRMMV